MTSVGSESGVERPFEHDQSLVIVVNEDDTFAPMCRLCGYVGVDMPRGFNAKAALTNHRTGVGHRRELRHHQTRRAT